MAACRWCGAYDGHGSSDAQCKRLKAIEYSPDGAVTKAVFVRQNDDKRKDEDELVKLVASAFFFGLACGIILIGFATLAVKIIFL